MSSRSGSPSPRARFLAAVLAALSLPVAIHAGPRLVRIQLPDAGWVEELGEAGAWEVLDRDGDTVLAAETEGLLPEAPPGLVEVFLRHEVLQPDLDSVFEPFRAQGSEGAYHNVQEVEDELTALAAAHPDRAEKVVIGRSVENRPLTALRIGPKDGGPRPTAIFAAMLHAREWITVEVAMKLVNELLAAPPTRTDPVIWVIPVVNPDGLHWSQTQYQWWRGNRRNHGGGRIGTDLNRNFPAGWGIGSSNIPGSQTYKGSAPLSEPESKALDDLVARVKPALTMTAHAFGRMVLRPYGFRSEKPGREDLFARFGGALSAASGYRTGSVYDLIGRTGGATDDHFVERHGAFAMSLEVGDSFIPAEDQIPIVVAPAVTAARTWLAATAELAGIDPRLPPTAAESRFGSLYPAGR